MKFNMMNGGARWNKPKPVQPETRMPRAAANDGRQAPIRKDRRNLPSANDSLIGCFCRIIAANRRVRPHIGVRKGFPSAGLGIFLDKRVGFAGGGWPNVGVMVVVVAAALRIHTEGNAGGRSNAAGVWNGVRKCRSGDSGGRFCARSGRINCLY